MKKFVSLLLCLAMVMGLAACGNSNKTASTKDTGKTQTESAANTGGTDGTEGTGGTDATAGESSGGAGAIDFEEEPYTLTVCYAVMGEAQPDLAAIEEKLNEITLREINAKVDLEAVSLFSMANVYALKASSQEKVDLMLLFPGSSYLTNFANSNLIMPIEEYVAQWGADLTAGLGDIMKAGEYKGHQYAIPQNGETRASGVGFKLATPLCEKYNINPDEIKTLEDLEAAFAIIKENEPDITVIMPETTGQGIAGSVYGYYDQLCTGGGMLGGEDGALKVINQTEDSVFIEACKKTQEWYEKGYISKDVLTNQEDGNSVLQAGRCFALAASSISPVMGDKYSKWVLINEEPPLVSTTNDQLLLWAVASSCQRPDKAVQFLNMCFASAEVANLMRFGIEDTHYTKLENGCVNTDNNANWQNFWCMFGDINNLYIVDSNRVSMGVDTVEEYKAVLQSWKTQMSPAYGFNFDPSNVKTQIAACDDVNNEYMLVVMNGTVDVEKELENWTKKLNDAGVQDVIAEKQKQLDEWLAAQ